MKHNIRRPPPPTEPINRLRQLPSNPLRGSFTPIGSHRIPRHHAQSKRTRNSKYDRSPRPERRSKILHSLTRNLLQHIAGPRQLLAHPNRRRHRQVRMTPGVVPNHVPLRCYPPHQPRLCLRAATQHEKRSLHVVSRQNIQQPRSPLRIWPVVEGQSQLPRPLRCNQRCAKNPRARPKRGICIASRSQPHGPGRAQSCVDLCCKRRKHSAYQCAALDP